MTKCPLSGDNGGKFSNSFLAAGVLLRAQYIFVFRFPNILSVKKAFAYL
jgi:hypothetical protein